MTETFVDIARSFGNRRGLQKKVALAFRDDLDRPRLFCDEPAIVARFASQLRQAAIEKCGPGTRVLMRGQAANHAQMTPGLFRPPSNAVDPALLVLAEEQFEKHVRSHAKLGRFRRPHLAALLQHYGYRTTWLDVVDNLWTSVWFATHTVEPADGRSYQVKRRQTGSGWLYFLIAKPQTAGSIAIDLRDVHHGLSLRPHAQSGWSVRSSEDRLVDLNDHVIGCVEFPITARWAFGGHLGSSEFMFPSQGLDNTLRRLIDKKVDAIAEEVETRLRLPQKALGRVFEIANIAT